MVVYQEHEPLHDPRERAVASRVAGVVVLLFLGAVLWSLHDLGSKAMQQLLTAPANQTRSLP